jgi:hypothetical protein
MVISCSKSSTSTGNNSGGGGTGGVTLNCTGIPNKFAADVKPIIDASCATNSSCHAAGSSNGPGPLTNYLQISGAKTLIKTAVANGTMPKTGSITTAQKNSILCWIEDGARDN